MPTSMPMEQDWIALTLESLLDAHGLLVAGLFIYNSALLAIGSLLLIWLMVRAVVATAQHGKIAGKHSEMWFPIRFLVALGLLLPLPPAGLNGGQQTIVLLAKLGSSLGNKIWATVGEGIGQMRPLVTPVPPAVHDLAHGVWLIQSCISIHNRFAATSGAVPARLRVHDFDDRSVLSGDGAEPGQCGSIIFPTFENRLALPINREHVRATMAMAESLKPVADAIAVKVTPPFDDASTQSVAVDVGAIVQRYAASVMRVASGLVEMSNSSSESRQALADETAKGGWVQAGVWALRIAATNAELTNAMNRLPATQPPRLDDYRGAVFESHRAAIIAADQWWITKMGQADKAIEAKAYGAGTEDSWWAPVDIARWRGLYDTMSVDADSAVNPIAEIANLGHGLLNVVGSSVATYVTLSLAGDALKATVEAIPLIGKPVAAIGGAIVSGVTTLAGGGTEKTSAMFWLVISVLWICGLSLAFGLPMMPFVYWILIVARFLIRTLTGILAAPLWAVAHLELDGEGLGDRTKPGYMLLLDILIRPAVSVLALLIGLGVFIALAKLFAMSFYPAVRSTLAGHYGGFSGMFAFTLLSVSVLVMLMHASLKVITESADNVLEMAGALVARTMGGGGQDHPAAAAAATGAATAGGAKLVGSIDGGSRRSGGNPTREDEGGTWAPRMDGSLLSMPGRTMPSWRSLRTSPHGNMVGRDIGAQASMTGSRAGWGSGAGAAPKGRATVTHAGLDAGEAGGSPVTLRASSRVAPATREDASRRWFSPF